MFTGIVETIGRVRHVTDTADGRRLEIELGRAAEGVSPGDSIGVSGCCQTVAALDAGVATFEAVRETLRRTSLAGIGAGDSVNLERSLSVGDRLDGHFVTGHVDGTARLTGVSDQLWTFEADQALLRQMVPKGSVAVDGVSLTLVDAGRTCFRVTLIPTTLRETTLGDLRPGGLVNIETDLLGKYVLQYLRAGGSEGLTLEKLRETGFLG